jgi:hypothetical protein
LWKEATEPAGERPARAGERWRRRRGGGRGISLSIVITGAAHASQFRRPGSFKEPVDNALSGGSEGRRVVEPERGDSDVNKRANFVAMNQRETRTDQLISIVVKGKNRLSEDQLECREIRCDQTTGCPKWTTRVRTVSRARNPRQRMRSTGMVDRRDLHYVQSMVMKDMIVRKKRLDCLVMY